MRHSGCDAGMYSGMTKTIFINYALVVKQYFLLHFTKCIGVDGSNNKLE